MSSLTLITGTIEDAEDPFLRLNPAELYYESWNEDPENENDILITREPIPIRYYSDYKFRISQYLGSGKTLLAMDILSKKVFYGGKVTANLGLVWDNEGKEKDEWISGITSFEDLDNMNNCTFLLDDIRGTIIRWNAKEAEIIGRMVNAGRKTNLDGIITAQREKMIPPEIRDIATDWIVPIIRVRDFTRETPDHTGYPIEMIALHFDGSKILKYISNPIINLDRLFATYSTMQKAISIKDISGEARPDQPGFKLEAEALEFLKQEAQSENWQHLNGKHVFDVIGDHYAIDVVGQDPDGHLYCENKDLTRHIRTAKAKGLKPFLMFKYGASWAFILINYTLSDRIQGKRISPPPTAIRTISYLVR